MRRPPERISIKRPTPIQPTLKAASPDAGSIEIGRCRIAKERRYVILWPLSDDHAIH